MPTVPIKGCDLSHWNKPVDFGAMVAAGVVWTALKATEGTGNIDPTFAERREIADEKMKVVGLYHFLHPTDQASDEAKHFASVVKSLRPHEFVAVDVEQTPGWSSLSPAVAAAKVINFVGALKVELGLHASDIVLYISIGWAKQVFGSHLADLTFLPPWIAHYASELGDTGPWTAEQVLAWQRAEFATIPGAGQPGSIDSDVWLNQAAFDRLAA